MPELPEVETVRRGLEHNLKGRRIEGVTVWRGNLRQPMPATLATTITGRTLTRLDRRAKYLLFHLSGGDVLIAHLGMSGSLVLKDKPSELRKHDHLRIDWSGGMHMFFHDPRRFGLILLTTEAMLARHKLFAGLGPEPLERGWNGSVLYAVLHVSKAPVKAVLMDQRKVVGIGNIYACEALFRAKIHPARRADKVTKKEAGLLGEAVKKVLREAIASGGSTLRDYVRSSGDGGYFQHRFSVYGRAGKPCLTCKTPIRSIRQSGRSTFFCPHCQK